VFIDVVVILYIFIFFNYSFHMYKGFYEYLKLKGEYVESHVGLDVLIEGTIRYISLPLSLYISQAYVTLFIRCLY